MTQVDSQALELARKLLHLQETARAMLEALKKNRQKHGQPDAVPDGETK